MQGAYQWIRTHYPLAGNIASSYVTPLFIISAGRSGTTLLRSMLAAGGQIAIPPEIQVLPKLPVKFLAYQSLGWEDLANLIIAEFESSHYFDFWDINLKSAYKQVKNLPESERSLSRIIEIIMMEYAAQKFPEAKKWGDQSPLNTFYLPYIRRVFPQAQYLHLVRDGRDVISSMVKRHGDEYLEEAVYRWNTSISRVRSFQKQANPENVLEIKYENLVQHPEETLIKVCSFIKVDYKQVMLDYWKLPTTIESKVDSFHKNLDKPVFSSSIGAWKERLSIDQQQYIMQRISHFLHEAGYEV